jgi:uncharacterized membrane protein YkoI
MIRTLTCMLALAISGSASAWIIDPVAAVERDATTAYAAQGSVSLAQATQMAQSRYPGQVARAETVSRGGRQIHVIRILGTDGRVRTVRIDAQTGAFL